MKIECASVVSRVVVHARGALVTREVALPEDLPAGVIDIAVLGVTIMAQGGSARASLDASDRLVTAVHTALHVPKAVARPGVTVTRVREISATLERLADEHRVLTERRAQLVDVRPSPNARTADGRQRERDLLDARFSDALAMSALVTDKIAALDERLIVLEHQRRDLARELESARLEDRQASSRERMGDAHPTRTITARLDGEGRPGRLVVTYAVAAARWWPSYTLRVDDAGNRAVWTFEAIVAQKTGEDWSGAQLALSSADLVFDARLPELASLRFGRAQPSKRRPLRPAPAGVDDMFAGYLAFGRSAFHPELPPLQPGPMLGGQADPAPMLLAFDEVDDDNETTAVNALRSHDSSPPPGRPMAPPAPAPMGMAMPQQAVMPMSKSMPAAESYSAPRPPLAAGRLSSMASMSFGSSGGSRRRDMGMTDEPAPEPEEPEEVLGDAWSDYDALVLANADDRRRGRLVPQPATEEAGAVARARRDVDAAAGDRYSDPADSRGMFDHRYEATGRAEIPSDGRSHRVAVATAPCTVKMAWRSVPSEAADVYREAHVTNPFESALLAGPLDVYLDGGLLAATKLERIDRGGTLWCGMGVDDRIKVARNIRVDEESAGLLGGSTAVTHTVQIELSSTLKDPVLVTVLERVPVTDDKAVEVKVVTALPTPAAYDQAERGQPVRGGYRFEVTVSPAKKAEIAVVYRMVFAAKLDIVGGSRRG